MWLSPTPRILYIDDDLDSCELMSLKLRYDNPAYQVATISTSDEALRLIENEEFDFYILDNAFPEVTGIELCLKILRKNFQSPVIFYSEMASQQDKNEALIAGAREYLVKPNDWEILPQTVAKLLTQKPSSFPKMVSLLV